MLKCDVLRLCKTDTKRWRRGRDNTQLFYFLLVMDCAAQSRHLVCVPVCFPVIDAHWKTSRARGCVTGRVGSFCIHSTCHGVILKILFTICRRKGRETSARCRYVQSAPCIAGQHVYPCFDDVVFSHFFFLERTLSLNCACRFLYRHTYVRRRKVAV